MIEEWATLLVGPFLKLALTTIVVLQYWLYDRTVITIVNYNPKTFIVQATEIRVQTHDFHTHTHTHNYTFHVHDHTLNMHTYNLPPHTHFSHTYISPTHTFPTHFSQTHLSHTYTLFTRKQCVQSHSYITARYYILIIVQSKNNVLSNINKIYKDIFPVALFYTIRHNFLTTACGFFTLYFLQGAFFPVVPREIIKYAPHFLQK